MVMNLLTGLALWMAAAAALGLLIGRAMYGYTVTYRPAPAPLVDADVAPLYEQAA